MWRPESRQTRASREVTCRRRVAYAVVLACVVPAISIPAAAATPMKTMTITKSYTVANLFTSDATAWLTAVPFPAPRWARSAAITVVNDTQPIIYWARWSSGSPAVCFRGARSSSMSPVASSWAR